MIPKFQLLPFLDPYLVLFGLIDSLFVYLSIMLSIICTTSCTTISLLLEINMSSAYLVYINDCFLLLKYVCNSLFISRSIGTIIRLVITGDKGVTCGSPLSLVIYKFKLSEI